MTEELDNLPEDDTIDLDDDLDADLDAEIDNDDELVELEENAPSKRRKDDYIETQVETALQANPKRVQARRKNNNLIETLINQNELETDDGKLRAWNALKARAEKSALPPKPYSIEAYLTDGDVIEHVNFGQGYIIATLSPTKVKVLFEDGLRKLVCNYKR